MCKLVSTSVVESVVIVIQLRKACNIQHHHTEQQHSQQASAESNLVDSSCNPVTSQQANQAGAATHSIQRPVSFDKGTDNEVRCKSRTDAAVDSICGSHNLLQQCTCNDYHQGEALQS